MNKLLKRIINALILAVSIAIISILVDNYYPGSIDRGSLLILLAAFSIMAIAVFVLINIAEGKEPDKQTLISLSAVGLKFFLAAIVALVYFEAFKKEGLNNILLFFILYLCFTIYIVAAIIKALNNRSLKRD